MPPKQVGTTKKYDTPVSARIPDKLRDELIKKHPKHGEISKLINILLQKYVEGRIFGVKLDSVS